MKITLALFTAILLVSQAQPLTGPETPLSQACSLWFVPVQSGNSTYCQCGDDLNGWVHCNNISRQVFLRSGICMTYDDATNQTLVGGCLYTANHYVKAFSDFGYVQLPSNVSKLNEFICGPYNRDGLLCGRCKRGFSPGLSTFIYNHKCIDCDSGQDTTFGWLAFFAVQVLPATVLFIIVVAFQVSAVTPSMNAYVFICQIITLPEFISFMKSYTEPLSSTAEKFQELLFSIYGVWNLDLLRPLIPNLCLSRTVNTHTVLMMEFSAAVYLLFLIVITYVAIVLHARNCRAVVYLWRPFNKCFTRFKRTWNLQYTMIDAFATFLLLCYNKTALICIRLLGYVTIRNINGEITGPPLYYYDPTVEFFSSTHLPIVVLSIFILSTVIAIPPLLLMFYQAKAFQKCLNRSHIRWNGLRTFVDKYQGCFKDGYSWGRDYRYFAGLYFGLRVLFAVITINAYVWAYVLLALSVITSLTFALLRPYKQDFYNKLDSLLFAVLAFAYFCKIMGEKMVSIGESLEDQPFFTVLVFVWGLLPLFYALGFGFYWVVVKRKLLNRCFPCKRQRPSNTDSTDVLRPIVARSGRQTPRVFELSNSLPDRVISPLRYQNLEASLSYEHVKEDPDHPLD